jgi:hypothetical protein
MAEYMVLLHEDPAVFGKLSPTQIQALIGKYSQWVGGLRAKGHVSLGKKLKDEGGRHLRADKGRMLASDGPYTEGKDIVSGFFILNADSYEQAQALLAGGPHFDFGWIELREVDDVG